MKPIWVRKVNSKVIDMRLIVSRIKYIIASSLCNRGIYSALVPNVFSPKTLIIFKKILKIFPRFARDFLCTSLFHSNKALSNVQSILWLFLNILNIFSSLRSRFQVDTRVYYKFIIMEFLIRVAFFYLVSRQCLISERVSSSRGIIRDVTS